MLAFYAATNVVTIVLIVLIWTLPSFKLDVSFACFPQVAVAVAAATAAVVAAVATAVTAAATVAAATVAAAVVAATAVTAVGGNKVGMGYVSGIRVLGLTTLLL